MPVSTTVTPAVIATALGRTAPTSPVSDQWQMWIDDALMLIQTRVDTITPTPTIDQARIDYVVREAVVSHVRKPEDVTQVTTSVDDGSTSKTYRSGTGRVTILDDWWSLLGLAAAGGGAYSVDTVPAVGLSSHPPFCSLYFGGTCSCGVALAGYPIYEGGY